MTSDAQQLFPGQQFISAVLGNFLGGGVLIDLYYAYVDDDAGYRTR